MLKTHQKRLQIMTITLLLIILNEIFCFAIPDLILIIFKNDLEIFFLINLNKGDLK